MRHELPASWGSGVQGETRSCSGVLREHSHVQQGPGAPPLGTCHRRLAGPGPSWGPGPTQSGVCPGNTPRGVPVAGRRQAKSDRVWDVALGAISFFLWDGCEIFRGFSPETRFAFPLLMGVL